MLVNKYVKHLHKDPGFPGIDPAISMIQYYLDPVLIHLSKHESLQENFSLLPIPKPVYKKNWKIRAPVLLTFDKRLSRQQIDPNPHKQGRDYPSKLQSKDCLQLLFCKIQSLPRIFFYDIEKRQACLGIRSLKVPLLSFFDMRFLRPHPDVDSHMQGQYYQTKLLRLFLA